MAKPSPQYLNLFLWLSGNLSDKMEMKITLSIPKMTSRSIKEINGIIASNIYAFLQMQIYVLMLHTLFHPENMKDIGQIRQISQSTKLQGN